MWWDDLVQGFQTAACCGANRNTDVVADQKKKWAEESGLVPMDAAPVHAQAVYASRRVASIDEWAEGNITVSSFGLASRANGGGGGEGGRPAQQPGEIGHQPDPVAQVAPAKARPRLQRAAPPRPPGVAEPLQQAAAEPLHEHEAVDLTLTLGLDYSAAGAEGGEERKAFERTLVRELSQACSLPDEAQARFVVRRVSAGSIVVVVGILPDQAARGPLPGEIAKDLEAQSSDPTSLLRVGSLTRHTHSVVCSRPFIFGAPSAVATRAAPLPLLQQQPPQQQYQQHHAPQQPHQRLTQLPPPGQQSPQHEQDQQSSQHEQDHTSHAPSRALQSRAGTPPRDLQHYSTPTGGKVGIGVVFDNRCTDGLRVSSLALDSPAFRTGSISMLPLFFPAINIFVPINNFVPLRG